MRRTDFLWAGTTADGWSGWLGALAVANFDGFLLGANHSQLLGSGWCCEPRFIRIPGLPLELVRNRRIREIHRRAREYFENFCWGKLHRASCFDLELRSFGNSRNLDRHTFQPTTSPMRMPRKRPYSSPMIGSHGWYSPKSSHPAFPISERVMPTPHKATEVSTATPIAATRA